MIDIEVKDAFAMDSAPTSAIKYVRLVSYMDNGHVGNNQLKLKGMAIQFWQSQSYSNQSYSYEA